MVTCVNSEAAAEVLDALAATEEDFSDEPTFLEWTIKASAALRSIFGAASTQVDQFEVAVEVKDEGCLLYTSPSPRDRS